MMCGVPKSFKMALWRRLADQGLTMLATEAGPVEVCVAFEALGRHAVPGPWVESAAYLPLALGREVEGVATVAVPPHVPYALDADVADAVYVAGQHGLREAAVGARLGSVDRTRRLFAVGGLDTSSAGASDYSTSGGASAGASDYSTSGGDYSTSGGEGAS
mgnify:CR=1 FL=1